MNGLILLLFLTQMMTIALLQTLCLHFVINLLIIFILQDVIIDFNNGRLAKMIQKSEIKKLARARLVDSKALCKAKRYDGAVYICGYVAELGLKLRICKTLNWDGFPSTNNEFRDFRSFKTHNINVLLSLSGVEQKIKTQYLPEWSLITSWDPEARYNPVGTIEKNDAELMIYSAETLLKFL